MRWRRRIHIEREGIEVVADVNAAVSVNRSEPGATNQVHSVSHARVVQDSRRPPCAPGGGPPDAEAGAEQPQQSDPKEAEDG
jgi:hypothetical protein